VIIKSRLSSIYDVAMCVFYLPRRNDILRYSPLHLNTCMAHER
jgi:hypothetical protein